MALEDLFREALGELLANEYTLVRKDAHEQSLCGRLAIYLDRLKDKYGYKPYYVDVEYNRRGEGIVSGKWQLGGMSVSPRGFETSQTCSQRNTSPPTRGVCLPASGKAPPGFGKGRRPGWHSSWSGFWSPPSFCNC